MLPKYMNRKEHCIDCGKEMTQHPAVLRADESAIEIEYTCECEYHITILYSDKHIETFKKALNEPETETEHVGRMFYGESAGPTR